MMSFTRIPLLCWFLLALLSCSQQQGKKERNDDPRMAGFKGKIAKTYAESKEDWPERSKAPAGAPNVLLILLDDVGFAQLGSYGGLIETPNIDMIANDGLRYTNFHTTALCSPSRASIMAGRNHHSIGLGSHAATAMGFPGYNGMIPPQAASGAKMLQENGYLNYALGKWDHTPMWEVTSTGPFNGWPSEEGFDHYYGFMSADIHNFTPIMYNDHWPSNPSVGIPDYHVNTDMADRAIYWLTSHASVTPEKPFMMFWASATLHAPHHASKKYRDMYKGKFDIGWDVARDQILKNQIGKGFFPAGTRLALRPDDIPKWDDIPIEKRKMYARQMEAAAAALTQADYEIGRIIEALKTTGAYDNTLIIVTSDNGASGEGGLEGSHNEMLMANGIPNTPYEENLRYYDVWGSAETNNHYHAGWAMAGNTPFKFFKQSSYNGGIKDPLIISWPKGILAKGEIRTQYHHITDIIPTVMEVTGVGFQEEVDGVKQMPFDGVSLKYSFDDANAQTKHPRQYYEIWGNRGIYDNGWKAVTQHGGRMPWRFGGTFDFEKDVWELYNLKDDPSEINDLSKSNPEKLEELKKMFEEEAWKYNVYPLYDDVVARVANVTKIFLGDKTKFTYYAPGAEFISESASPPIKNRSHSIVAHMTTDGKTNGVITACGGNSGGYSLYVKDNILTYTYNYLDENYYTIKAGKPISAGQHIIRLKYDKQKDMSAVATLFIDDVQVGQGIIAKEEPAKFSPGSEPFDVGSDNGGAVVRKAYTAPFKFSDKLYKVVFELQPLDAKMK